MGKPSEVIKTGITPRVIVISVLLMPIGLFLSSFLNNLTTRPWTFAGFFVPYIWILIISELFARVNPKWRLSVQEIVLIMIPMLILNGSLYMYQGNPHNGLIVGMGGSQGLPAMVYLASTDPYKSIWIQKIPSFWMPDAASIEQAWRGLLPGEAINWGAWIVSMTFWGLYWVAWAMLGLFVVALFRKPMIEDERLPVVSAWPISYTVLVYSQIDPEKNRSKLFSFKGAWNKAFWAGFFIGLGLEFIPFMAEVYPAIPVQAGTWGAYFLTVSPWTKGILPGAEFGGWFEVPTLMYIFLPTDVLWTYLIAWLVFGIGYNTLAVYTGAVTYVSGSEDYGAWYYGWNPPFHYSVFANTGIVAGIGIWSFVVAWPHIKKAFSTLVKKEDYLDQGISMRKVCIGIIAFLILSLALRIVSGIPLHVALAAVVLWILFMVAATRVIGATGYEPPVGIYFTLPNLQATGSATGSWSWTTPNDNSVAIRTMLLESPQNSWSMAYEGYPPFNAVRNYKMTEICKTRADDMFKWHFIMVTIGIMSAMVLAVWWPSHVGGLQRQSGMLGYASGNVGTAAGSGLESEGTSYASGYTLGLNTLYMIGGAVLTIATYLLRARFPWFVVNPAALPIAIFIMEWEWTRALVALPVKLVLLKIGGVRLLEERVLPLVVGFYVGWGILILPIAIRSIFVEAWPLWASYFVP